MTESSQPYRQERRSYSAPVLRTWQHGDPEEAALLSRALQVPPMPATRIQGDDLALVEGSLSVHLFHSFAARTHPLAVRHLLKDAGVKPGQVVWDPFVGGGTTLVEAALLGAQGVGTDTGALQVRLSRFKATPLPTSMRKALVERATEVARASLERVKKRLRPEKTWDTPSAYEPHIYLELCGLRLEVERVLEKDPPLGEALLLLLSSILIKASKQRAESVNQEVVKTLGRGVLSKWFQNRAIEFDRLAAAFAERVPKGTPRPLVYKHDARVALSEPGLHADVVLTSPPYLGVYDYAAHQKRRLAFLDELQESAQENETEIGSRRQVASLGVEEALRSYRADTQAWMANMAQRLKESGRCYVFIGDPSLAGWPGLCPSGQEILAAAADRVGLRIVAAASVERQAGKLLTKEHLVYLAR